MSVTDGVSENRGWWLRISAQPQLTLHSVRLDEQQGGLRMMSYERVRWRAETIPAPFTLYAVVYSVHYKEYLTEDFQDRRNKLSKMFYSIVSAYKFW